jgi:2,3-bisphosphoglycerate-dependent phosphoglycerate mutase
MSSLILVRHGESQWNLSNRFTGWVDIPLSQRGVEEALACAQKLEKVNINHAFTSCLERAHETLTIILSRQKKNSIFLHPGDKKQDWYSCDHHSEQTDILIHTTRLLNERYYGLLQGLNKDKARQQFGENQVTAWRRGYDQRPPGGESLEDVYKRVIPFFLKRVVPLLKNGRNVIVSTHGNTMRVIVKYIEKIPIEQVPHLNLLFGEPITYDYVDATFSRLNDSLTFDRSMP